MHTENSTVCWSRWLMCMGRDSCQGNISRPGDADVLDAPIRMESGLDVLLTKQRQCKEMEGWKRSQAFIRGASLLENACALFRRAGQAAAMPKKKTATATQLQQQLCTTALVPYIGALIRACKPVRSLNETAGISWAPENGYTTALALLNLNHMLLHFLPDADNTLIHTFKRVKSCLQTGYCDGARWLLFFCDSFWLFAAQQKFKIRAKRTPDEKLIVQLSFAIHRNSCIQTRLPQIVCSHFKCCSSS